VSILLFGGLQQVYADERVLRLTTTDWAPFYGVNLQNNGPLTEIVKEAFGVSDIPVDVNFVPWSRALQMAKTGHSDGVMGLYYNAERSEYLVYSEPIFLDEIVLAGRAENRLREYADLRELQGYKIGVSQGWIYSEAFDSEDYLIKDVALTPVHNIRKLVANRIDLMAVSRYYLQNYLRSNRVYNNVNVVTLDPPLKRSALYVGISRKLVDRDYYIKVLNRGLAEIQVSGKYDDILRKHNFLVTQ